MSIHPGLSNQFEVEVEAGDTARALGSGDLDVLGTPRIVALAEEATIRAITPELADGETTVGVEVFLQHLRAALPGARVSVSAELTGVDDNRLEFAVRAQESDLVVAEGTVRRMIVDTDRFLRGASEPRDN